MRKRILPRTYTTFLKTTLLLLGIIMLFSFSAEAASKAATNSKADALYKEKVQEMKADVKSIWYKFTDITGDGIHEAIIIGKTISGSGNLWKVYTYKSGAAKIVFDGV